MATPHTRRAVIFSVPQKHMSLCSGLETQKAKLRWPCTGQRMNKEVCKLQLQPGVSEAPYVLMGTQTSLLGRAFLQYKCNFLRFFQTLEKSKGVGRKIKPPRALLQHRYVKRAGNKEPGHFTFKSKSLTGLIFSYINCMKWGPVTNK